MKWVKAGAEQYATRRGRWDATVFRPATSQRWTVWFIPVPFFSMIQENARKYRTMYGAKMAAERTLRGTP